MFDTIPGFAAIPALHHVISTRHGGVSEGGFASLNLGYHVQDDPARVLENRRRLAAAAGYDAAALVAAQQVHGTGLAWVSTGERGRGAFSWEEALPATDGLLTAQAGLPLAVQVADCAPVLLVDPVQRVLAVVHAGWRGALAGIASAAVREMVARADSSVHDLRIGIGPTLCPACLEVGDEVASAVAEKFGANTPIIQQSFHPSPFSRHPSFLDIRALIAADLATVWVNAAQITHNSACTRCQLARFFSHRGQHGQAGRFALVAWWE